MDKDAADFLNAIVRVLLRRAGQQVLTDADLNESNEYDWCFVIDKERGEYTTWVVHKKTSYQ
jgi:hypothetical protein